MADKFNPPVSSYPSPLTGYENAEPIGNGALRRHSNNKVEMKNLPNDKLSEAYNRFPVLSNQKTVACKYPMTVWLQAIDQDSDVHICHFWSNEAQERYARRSGSVPDDSVGATIP
jgi:hypothetical protein